MKAAERREAEIAAFAPPSVERADTIVIELEQFLKASGAQPDIFAAMPRDIVRFFMAKDCRGRTKVHVSSCSMWGVRKTDECDCPRRLKYSSLRSQKFLLQGAYRDRGWASAWCPRGCFGNPCRSAHVDRYLAATELEQCEGGVSTVQSTLVDVSVFNKIMLATMGQWSSTEDTDRMVSAQAARDALLYALLWETGLRAADALRLLHQAVTPVWSSDGKTRGLAVNVARAKAVLSLDKTYVVTVWDTESDYTAVKAYRMYQSALEKLNILPAQRNGSLFRSFVVAEDSTVTLGARCTWAAFDRLYEARLRDLGFPAEARRHLTLHSFHGSRAAREMLAGIVPSVTCASMHWSMEMYLYYTKGRVPTSMDDVRIMLEAEVV